MSGRRRGYGAAAPGAQDELVGAVGLVMLATAGHTARLTCLLPCGCEITLSSFNFLDIFTLHNLPFLEA